jgi:outer membrane protein assembly factor BamB
MQRFLCAGLVLLIGTTSVFAQADRSGIYTNALPPAREALERLNLKLGWQTFVQMDGKKDAIVSIRLTGKHLLLQTRSGLVTQIDAETGHANWRNRIGNPYQILQPLTYNSGSAFVLNNNYLYGLDRSDGSILFQMSLPVGIAAPPIADEEQIYLPTVLGRLRAYRLPSIQAEKEFRAGKAGDETKKGVDEYTKSTNPYDPPRIKLPPPGQVEKIGAQPLEAWTGTTNLRLDFQPMVSGDVVALASSNGQMLAFNKVPYSAGSASTLYRFHAEGELLAPPGQFDDTIYLGSRDANVYAIDILTGRVLWRHTAGSAVHRQPFATREDLYVTSERNGLTRLKRSTGETMWSIPRGNRTLVSQPDLDRVLAVNPKFVYATDRSGRLAVVDRIRGTILSTYDLRDFVVLTPNEWSDRLYLAAQNGLVICLHDREYKVPHMHREQENNLARKLIRPVTIQAADKVPLKDLLRNLERETRVKFFLSVAAFKEQGKEKIDTVEMSFGKIDGDSLRDALKKILDPIEATFEPIEETLFIVPKGQGKKDKPPEKEKEKEKNG